MSSIIDPCQFKALMMLRDNWQSIRDECAALDRNDVLETERGDLSNIEAARMLAASGRAQWMKAWGLNKDRWLTWGFAIDDQYPLGDAGAPNTVRLLRRVQGLKVAALSLFRPGVVLPVHEHPELKSGNLLTFHLGLEVPEKLSFLNADGQFEMEEEGKAIVFDASRPHHAFNASSKDRLILYCEFSPDRIQWLE